MAFPCLHLPKLFFVATLFCEGKILESKCSDADFDEAMAVGVRLSRIGQYDAALPCFQRAFSLRKTNVGALLYLGESCLKTGRTKEAAKHLEAAQTIQPGQITGWLLLGSARQRNGDILGAVEAYDTALKLDENNVAALVNGGTALREMGEMDTALARLQRAVMVAPHVAEAAYNLGDILLAQERYRDAATAAETALKLMPALAAAHVLKVLALEGEQQYTQAVDAADRGLALAPSNYALLYERARMLRSAGRLAQAETAFKRCIAPSVYSKAEGARASNIAYAHNEYAHLLSQLGRQEEARAQWRLSVQADPSFAQGWVNAASQEDGLNASLQMYGRAVALSPGLAEGWINIGQVYYNHFRQDASYMSKALEAFGKAFAAAPSSSSALYSLARTRVDLCRWEGWDELFDRVAAAMERDLHRGTLLTSSISLVYLLVYPVPDALLHAAYSAKAALVHQTAAGLHWRDTAQAETVADWRQGRVTIGYVSGDLREHPVSLLFQRVPALHDHSRFRVVLFALQPAPPEDRIWPRLAADADAVQELWELPTAEAIRAVQREHVSVLVDMSGYTQHARPELFAAGAAGTTVGLLGFAASVQGGLLDGLATDAVASPPELRGDYSEGLLYLPGTFYLADHLHSWHTRRLASPSALPAVTKAQVGLRPGALVLASFNQPFKIDPGLFGAWMRIMRRLPAAQLWIVTLNEGASAESALRARALAHGVGGAGEEWRLFFTGSADVYDHVAYKSAADLMLDTRLYNAHSTAADALFAGVPVLTLPGRRMVARVGASIAGGAGHAHLLVARDLADYEHLAVALGACPLCLARARRRLVEGRGRWALYDVESWVRRWEAGLRMLLELSRLPPRRRPPPTAPGHYEPRPHVIVADGPWPLRPQAVSPPA